ncbi:MAG: response regulator [Sandarakinorhabdus sp.]|nr:response regulator [Sandarakinorhabdus sp.]
MASDSAAAILVVEDEALTAMLVVMDLEDAGYGVVTASNAEEAIAMLEVDGASFRALVTDVNFASHQPTGWDLARRARAITDDLPVVYISGASGHEWQAHGVAGSRMIAKPFSAGQIVKAVSQLLEG